MSSRETVKKLRDALEDLLDGVDSLGVWDNLSPKHELHRAANAAEELLKNLDEPSPALPDAVWLVLGSWLSLQLCFGLIDSIPRFAQFAPDCRTGTRWDYALPLLGAVCRLGVWMNEEPR